MSNLFFRTFQHLLPKAKAWRLSKGKNLTKLFDGLSKQPQENKDHIDNVWFDIFPESTRELENWEKQFGIDTSSTTTENQRRDYLDSEWKFLGGQSPKYIQDKLRAAGFDVYVHEWWEPNSTPEINKKQQAIPRNPHNYIAQDGVTIYLVECGSDNLQCGEEVALCGNKLSPSGYLLVNKIYKNEAEYIVLCGEYDALCGESEALCGNTGYNESLVEYTIPNDSQYYPYFLYIGAETFPGLAQVPTPRRAEFERLLLKISPAQQWLGILVEYV
ncbi:putative phage tail protein [Francisella philomiragia]|uniref:putative phage tail protein n=1 Tax=Francisella philomiragia TaxID=28110 RepID=UPI0022441014|nr:putative phage tail protein [Francisella philomiragia]